MLKKGLNKQLVIAIIVVFAIGLGLGLFGSKFGFKERSVSTKLVAVDDEGNGVTADLTATVRTGKGLVLVNINNLVADIDTQTSARKAAEVAAGVSGFKLDKYDVIFNIVTNANRISGGSAGTPMTLAAIAAFENKSLRDDVAVTGIIGDDGQINPVGGIVEKAIAAKTVGMKTILVPSGFDKRGIERRRTKDCTKYKEYDFCEISYRDMAVDVGDLGIELKEIANIREALQYAIKWITIKFLISL